jgi:hypothetical protein
MDYTSYTSAQREAVAVMLCHTRGGQSDGLLLGEKHVAPMSRSFSGFDR